MHSPPASTDHPRVLRAVGLQLATLIALAIVAERPWARAKPPAPPVIRPAEKPAEKVEQRVRVVKLPPLPAPRPARLLQTAVKPPQPAPNEPPPAQQSARAEPLESPPAPREPRAPAAPARQHIAANATAVHGVQLRILVPSNAVELATHLRNSGGCMVVSRLAADGAEVVSVLSLASGRAVEQPGPPCAGVPRLLRDGRLNDALGDPIGRARAQLALAERGDELVLQVLLTPQLQDSARLALRSRFGGGSEADVARLAAEAGYQLTCFAEPAGAVRCE